MRGARELALCLAASGLALPAAAGGRTSTEKPPVPAVAFVDVSVVTMESDRVLRGQTVVVSGDRIAAVGPPEKVAAPKGALRIGGRGQYLVPGLADMHVHIPPEASDPKSASRELLLLVAHGITTARVMIGQPEHLVLRDKIGRGELLGPTLHVAGPPVGVPAGSLPGVPGIESPGEAGRVPAEQKKAGYDLVKVLDGLPADQYEALAAAARDAGIPMAGHVPDQVGLARALAARQASIEHLSGYVEDLLPLDSPLRRKQSLRLREVLPAIDEARIPRVVAATREAGVWNTPTLYFWKALVSAESPEELRLRPGMEYVAAKDLDQWAEQRRKSLAASPPLPDVVARYHALRARLTKALRDGGARLLLGTDSPDVFTVAGVAAHEELKLMVAAGLTPYEALRAGTRDAAEFVGGLEEFGTVAAGRRADLVLLDANPLEDVANLGRRAGVMVRGRWLPQPWLEQQLLELTAHDRAPAR